MTSSISTESPLGLEMEMKLKQLQIWFSLWHQWQKRIVVSHIIEHCSLDHLQLLATSLEPILHLDFSYSPSPMKVALHYQDLQTFRIQRTVNTIKETRFSDNGHTFISQHKQNVSQSSFIPHQSMTFTNNCDHFVKSRKVTPAIPIDHKSLPTSVNLKMFFNQESHKFSLPPLLIRQYNSVPNLRLTTDFHDRMKAAHQETLRKKYKTMSIASTRRQHLQYRKQYQFQLYKKQLVCISKWMSECSAAEKAKLLGDFVKMFDKELLLYLVQCLHHRLQLQHGIESLSDSLILKIFSNLDAKSLSNCGKVCRQWYYLVSSGGLWRDHCAALGRREGIGDIAGAIEAVHNISSDSMPNAVMVDWMQAYKEFDWLMSKIKAMVIKAADSSERTERLSKEQVMKLTSAHLRSSLTLREMLDLVQATCTGRRSTTHEVLLSAPESAATQRRRLRSEKAEKERLMQKLRAQKHKIFEESQDHEITDGFMELNDHTYFKSARIQPSCSHIHEVLDTAIDSRPSVPSLPNPEGIESLVLGGFLSHVERLKLGQADSIPMIQRLTLFDSSVLCLQCDERKIVAGCADRVIRVFDIRSGRLVSTLQGHKGSVQCLQFDEHKIVSGSWDTTCIVWNIVHFTALKTLVGHLDCVSCLKFSDETLVTGSYDESLKVWETISWQCLRTIYPAHEKSITCLAFDGTTVFSGSDDKTVKLWNTANGRCQVELDHPAEVTSLVISGLLLITGCRNGDIHLWNLCTRTELMQWKMMSRQSSAGPGYITCVFVDRGKVFGAGSDSILYEWDIATGACVRTLQGHLITLTGVWAGNYKIVTTAQDKTICIWSTKKTSTQIEGNIDSSECYFLNVPVRTITIH